MKVSIRCVVYVILFFSIVSFTFSQEGDIEKFREVVSFIVSKDYDKAISILKSFSSSDERIVRKVNYYLSECYFLKKDFSNALYFGEKVLGEEVSDFYHQKTLYNVIISSYMLNNFSKCIEYSKVYIEKFGDSQGLEANVLTVLVNSLQAVGKSDEASKILEEYKDKYPEIYFSMFTTLTRADSESMYGNKESLGLNELELREIIENIKKNLEEISKRRDKELEKIEGVIELLSLKEELLKLKKYKMISD